MEYFLGYVFGVTLVESYHNYISLTSPAQYPSTSHLKHIRQVWRLDLPLKLLKYTWFSTYLTTFFILPATYLLPDLTSGKMIRWSYLFLPRDYWKIKPDYPGAVDNQFTLILLFWPDLDLSPFCILPVIQFSKKNNGREEKIRRLAIFQQKQYEKT